MLSGQRATRNLALATIAFTICFTSWGLVAPRAKHLQTPNGWSDTQVLLLAAVPVLCGEVFLAAAVSAVEGWFVDGEEWIVRGRATSLSDVYLYRTTIEWGGCAIQLRG